MESKSWTPADIMRLSTQTWANCTLQAAINLDLFTQLDRAPNKSLSVGELAAALACEARATGMLVTALVALNYLEREGELIRITEASSRYLSADSEDYQGFTIKHMSHIMPGWITLDQSVRTGTSSDGFLPITTEDENEREAFLMAMFNVARQQAEQVAQAFDLTGCRRLLDLGGGPGTYAIYFCRHNPELKAVVFDRPTTERFARSVAERYHLAHRVDFLGGDFIADTLPGGFDVVWLSQVIHGESPEQAAGLIKRAAGTISSGGLLGVQEFIIDDDRRGPAQPALFALNMLLQTPGGQAYTQDEIMAMMVGAGLKNIRRLAADLPPGCGILVGAKP